MTIDLLNAHKLIRGENYLITLPEMEPECALLIHAQLEEVSEEMGVRFVVLIGEVAMMNAKQVN
jgi:hypothetical protein